VVDPAEVTEADKLALVALTAFAEDGMVTIATSFRDFLVEDVLPVPPATPIVISSFNESSVSISTSEVFGMLA
jgi:hypothetical protein